MGLNHFDYNCTCWMKLGDSGLLVQLCRLDLFCLKLLHDILKRKITDLD